MITAKEARQIFEESEKKKDEEAEAIVEQVLEDIEAIITKVSPNTTYILITYENLKSSKFLNGTFARLFRSMVNAIVTRNYANNKVIHVLFQNGFKLDVDGDAIRIDWQ